MLNGKILVVEDDFAVRETLSFVLRSEGFQVQLAENMQEAVESLQNSWSDVMLLDLSVQDLDGEVIYSSILEQFGDVPPTLVLSGAHDGEQRVEQMSGAEFLAKPYSVDDLLSRIRKILSQRSKKAA